MNVLSAYLIPALEERYGNLSVIKKGNNYFTVGCKSFTFKDVLNYTSPVNLSTYLKQWNVTECKAIYPYTFFNNISEIKLCTNFPDYSAFYSDLRQSNISREEYERNKSEYNKRKELLPGNPDRMTSMHDWLYYYNCLDCQPLCKAIENSFSTFHQIFEIDPASCLSLPSLAQSCMFQTYASHTPYTYSFSQKMDHVRKIFRQNIVGGIVNVFSRYTDVRTNPPTDAPYNALYAPDGHRFTKITFLDFNSLYLTVQQNNFPTTPGIILLVKKNIF